MHSDASLGEFYWASSFADHPSDALPDITDPQICPPPELDDSARLYIQKDAPIRIRIEEETFSPVGPKEPPKVVAPPVGLGGEVKVAPEENVPEGPPPYALIVRPLCSTLAGFAEMVRIVGYVRRTGFGSDGVVGSGRRRGCNGRVTQCAVGRRLAAPRVKHLVSLKRRRQGEVERRNQVGNVA